MPPHIPPGGKNFINQRRKTADGFVTKSQSNLPSDIVCFVCEESKPRTEYANRQLQRFSDTIHNPYAPGGRTKSNPKTTCKTCTPQQVSQLTCMICDKTKPLDKFAKNQRKDPHAARCKSCIKMHLETEPDYEPPDSDEYGESASDSEPDFDDNGKPPAGGGAFYNSFNENVSASSHAASAAFTEDASGEADDDHWKTVKSAGSRPIAQRPPLPSLHATASVARSSATTSTTTKKGGWARPEKVNEAKLGPNSEVDEWDSYARGLKNRRDASYKPKKKKHTIESDPEYDS